jgi:hypothetical protein
MGWIRRLQRMSVQFPSTDVVALRRHFVGSGAETRGHNGEIPGRPRFFAVDSFGNTIEFVTFEPEHW